MQCPLCNRTLKVKLPDNSFACHCSDLQDSETEENLADMVLNFEGAQLGSPNKRFSIWLDLDETVGDTLIFYCSRDSWELAIEHHGSSQSLQEGLYYISPEDAVKIMRRYQNLLVFA